MLPPQSHRQPILDAAIRLFRRQGYGQTGLSRITALGGAPKGSVYHHFPGGKAQIAQEAIQHASGRVVATLERLDRETPSAARLVARYTELLAKWSSHSQYRDGCPIATVLLELAAEEDGVRRSGEAALHARLRCLTRKLKGDGYNPEEAREPALLTDSAIEGALVYARVERSGRPVLAVGRSLSKVLARLS